MDVDDVDREAAARSGASRDREARPAGSDESYDESQEGRVSLT